MEPIYTKTFEVTDLHTDRFGNLKPSAMAFFIQEVSGDHCSLLKVDYDSMGEKQLFWAIIRHKLQITRVPKTGEHLRLETWPMPTTRTAFPRSVIAYDEAGREVFRSIALWVLMDPQTRAMVLPKNSGVLVPGILRGNELSVPGGLIPGTLGSSCTRSVRYTDLDINGHMNNTRYLDWVWDLLPSPFHREHQPRQVTLCYLSEAREGEDLQLQWFLNPAGSLQTDITREGGQRVFSALIEY